MQIELVKCEVNVLELRPSQTLIVKMPPQVPLDAMQKARAKFAEMLKVDLRQIIVVPQGVDFEVIDQPPSLDMGVQKVGAEGVVDG